ncbi:MAG: hydrogenase iron-sulfur subunit [Nitrospinota bacterium]|nr:MAG: hydrogenase iron-sulfur subunit [Nitrospinota bacterium]
MAGRWGLVLCNCRQHESLAPLRLALSMPCVQISAHPEPDLDTLTRFVQQEELDHLLISCCQDPGVFSQSLASALSPPPLLHFLDLNSRCFWVHPDPVQAQAKAIRLVRGAMQAAEAQEEPAYNPLSAGKRIVIGAETPQGLVLAARLHQVAQPLLLLAPRVSLAGGDGDKEELPYTLVRGQIVAVRGRLGDFRVTIEERYADTTRRQDLPAAQVVILLQTVAPPIKKRTGCHVLVDPGEADLERVVQEVQQLIGHFLKPVHVTYQETICAGGAADQEACGRCIPACPYDAISRDPRNHLRIRVDQMTCEGCGACTAACPTSALRFTDPSPRQLYSRLAAFLSPSNGDGEERPVVLFHCGEEGYRALETAAQQSIPYPANVFPIEVPCLRFVSQAYVLAAFRLGAAGVGFLGCESCQHGERELFYQQYDFCRLILEAFALGTERLRLITTEQGREREAIATLTRFAETVAPSPLSRDGHPMGVVDHREVIREAIAVFIEQLGQEPGRRTFTAPHPFALAEVDAPGCTLCRSCVNVCPVHAFRFAEESFSLQLQPIACVACGLCETACPERVITLRHEIYLERDALEYQVVAQDEMIPCTRCGKPFINKRALEAVEARLLSLDSLLDAFQGKRRHLLRMCPDCRAVAAMFEVQRGWEP